MKKVVFVFILLSLSACKSKTVYIPVESVKTEYKDKFIRDSVYLQDSIIIKMRADTVFFEKYKYLYKDKLIRDSIYKTDSVQVPYPVIEYKEVNRLYKWQMVLMSLGGALIGYLCYYIVRIFMK